MFGTRQIIAKIVNNKLMIRVGGGFMTIDEFITQYGPIEMLKFQQAQEIKNNPGGKPRSKSSVSPSKMIAKNVAAMRQTIKSGIGGNDSQYDSRGAG